MELQDISNYINIVKIINENKNKPHGFQIDLTIDLTNQWNKIMESELICKINWQHPHFLFGCNYIDKSSFYTYIRRSYRLIKQILNKNYT